MRCVNQEQVTSALAGVGTVSNSCFEMASIIIVGGILDSGNRLSVMDEAMLKGIVTRLVERGVRLSQNVNVQSCNLEHGDDFIRDTPTADLLLFAWVNNGISDQEDKAIGLESPLLDLGQTWKSAIKDSNSPFIGMVTDNLSCVGRRDVPDGYVHMNADAKKTVHDYPVYSRNDMSFGL